MGGGGDNSKLSRERLGDGSLWVKLMSKDDDDAGVEAPYTP